MAPQLLVIRTKSGTEVRIPLDDLDGITEIEPVSGTERQMTPHPYVHREGVNRCAACWRDRTDPAHSDTAVHER